MRHFTQRLMMAIVATFMAVGSLWANATITFGSPIYDSSNYYEYTATSACSVTATVDYPYTPQIMWSEGGNWPSVYAKTYTWNLSAGQKLVVYISVSAGNSYSVTFTGGAGGPVTPPTAQPGDDPEHAIVWNAGSNSILEARTRDIWYKVNVAASSKLFINTPYFSDDMQGFVGLADANVKANPVEIKYDFDKGPYGNYGEYSNISASDVDFYIYHKKNAYSNPGTANISIESLGSLNDAKSIGDLQFDITNQANVGTATSSVLVTFPSFVGGALSEYNMAVLYTVNELTDEWNNYGSVMGYYRVVANGTASAGVQLPLPTLVDGKKYQVCVDRVDVTNGNLGKDFSSANSVSFAATNIPDGSESNPFIISEAGVAGPTKTLFFGQWTWYKYVVPSDGKVTISHTWSNASITTNGFIRVNGEQVRGNVPDSWSQGCNAGDIIMVAMATEQDANTYLVKGSVSEPEETETRETAKMLNVGDNSILKVLNGAMSAWYKFNLAANYEATLTFNGGIAAKYYIGSATTGSNISNNEEGLTELVYLNESASAVDVFIEVTGTNDHTPTATLVLEDQTPAPVEAPVFVSGVNDGHPNGSNVASLGYEFDLNANAVVADIVQDKFHLTLNDVLQPAPNHVGFFDNQAFLYFTYPGFSAAGTYKIVVEEGAATIGGEACGACEFVWTIGGAASDCDAPMADDEVSFASAKSGEAVAGAEGITMMGRDFEITCFQSGLTRYNSSVGVKLDMPWAGSTFDITSYIRDWQFDCEKITFTLSYDLDYSLLSTAGDWKLYIYEESFQDETGDIYSGEKTFTWTVAPAVVYNNPTITGATNSGEAAGSKMSMLSENFYLTLSEASNYADYGVSYQYNGATDWDATVNVSMNAEGTVATVNVSGVDLTREGEHAINVTYGAFVNANDETKVLTSGQKFNWYIGDYAITGTNADGVEPGSDEIDNKMFKNAFYLSLNYPSTPKSSFSVKLKKDGADFLTSTAKPTKMDGAGKEWKIVFSSWPKVNYSYAALEPGVYTLELPAGAFTNDLIGGESTAAYNVSWNVIHMVYPWSLVTTSHTTPVLAGSKTPGSVNEKFSHVFNVTFDAKYSNVAQGAGAITLVRDEQTIAENPVVVISGNTATITFGDEDFGVDGVYTLNIAEGAFTATYTQDGDDTPSNNVNCSSSSFTWNVTVPAVVYNAPNIVSATNGGNAAGTVAEVSNVFVLTFDEETQWLGTSYYAGVSYLYEDAPRGSIDVVMSADKRTATITVSGADAFLNQNGEHKLNITGFAFANANDETKTVAAANYVWTREGVEFFDINMTEDGYASFCWDKNWTVPAGVTIYKAIAHEDDMILIEEVYGVVKAGEGVILYAPGESQVTATATAEAAEAIPGNILIGTTVLTVNPAYNNASVTVYALRKAAGEATVFQSYTGENIPANKAYIQLGAGAPARLRVAMAGNTTTGMEAAATVNGGVSKRLINGQLFILRDGKMYNVQGVKL